MLEELKVELDKYFEKWQALKAGRKNTEFFEGLKPVAVGWKFAEKADYEAVTADLRDKCDRIVETWMNDRWIAKMHLKDQVLPGGISIIKVMQRRPGSDDALDLDHVDFYSPAVKDAEEILKNEPDLKWSWESNNVVDDYKWISLWFDGTEAKLKPDTILDIIQKELAELNQKVKDN